MAGERAWLGGGACMAGGVPGGMHSRGGVRGGGHERAVSILLECILVYDYIIHQLLAS